MIADECESMGPGKQPILHGNPSAVAKDFSPQHGSPSTSFLPNMHYQCCVILQSTQSGNFDIFTASGEATAWVLLWKTRSRPIGLGFVLQPNLQLFQDRI